MKDNESNYRESHLGKGMDYDAIFQEQRDLALLWDIEQRVLRQALDLTAGRLSGAMTHLDFACGTGRVLAACAPFVRSSTGVDVSERMMAVAHDKAQGAAKEQLASLWRRTWPA